MRISGVQQFINFTLHTFVEGKKARLSDDEIQQIMKKRLVEHPQLQTCSQKCRKWLFVSVNFCHLGLISFITMQARNHGLKSERCSPRPTTKCAQLADPKAQH